MTLGDLVSLTRGTTYQSALLGQPGPVLLGLASIKRNGGFRDDNLKTYGGECPEKLTLRPGDIYVSLKDVTQAAELLGAIARVPPHIPAGRVTQDTVKLTFTSDDIPSRYIYWLLRTPAYREYCRTHAIGTTNLALPREDFLAFPIPRPKESEMALAEVLDALDDKIELNRRMNATLEAMARALFQSWFVDFDPVRAKLDGKGFNSPRRNGESQGFESPYLHLFPDSFQDSALGPIPKGWEIVKLGDLCSKITDGAHQSPKSVERGRPMASVKDMTNWGINIEGCRHISEADFASLVANGCQPQEGDVLLAKDGATCLDTACEYRQSDEIVLLSSVAILRPKFLHVSSYVHIWLGLDATKFYLKESFVSGSAIPRVVLRDLKQARILMPPPAVLKAFDDAVAPLRSCIRQNDHQSRTLATLRDTLLPKLLSGEISIDATP